MYIRDTKYGVDDSIYLIILMWGVVWQRDLVTEYNLGSDIKLQT